MKNSRLLSLLLLTIAGIFFGISSCKNDDEGPYSPYLADWIKEMSGQQNFTAQLSLYEDGTFAWIPLQPSTGHETSTGNFSVADHQIIFHSGSDCSEDGTYQYTYQDNKLTLQVENDDCQPRISALEGTWDFKDENTWIALKGKWRRKHIHSDTAYDFQLEINENATFSWTMIDTLPGYSDFSGRFAATLDNIIFYDGTGCGDTNGYYHFGIDESQLTISYISDPCEDRSTAMIGIWILYR